VSFDSENNKMNDRNKTSSNTRHVTKSTFFLSYHLLIFRMLGVRSLSCLSLRRSWRIRMWRFNPSFLIQNYGQIY